MKCKGTASLERKIFLFYLHFSLLDLSTSATLYPTMQINCKEEERNERKTELAQDKTCLNRALVLLIKLKHFEGAQVLGLFGNSNGKGGQSADEAQTCTAALACNRHSDKIRVIQWLLLQPCSQLLMFSRSYSLQPSFLDFASN